MPLLRRALAAILLAAAAGTPASAQEKTAPSAFDFYVLALSWSPSYCESAGGDADPQQCAAAKPFGFIVHGLWPQNERGAPERCAGERDVPRGLARSLGDIMPSPGLIRHEWRTHGTCSGLTPDGYFALLRKARERVVVPASLRDPQTRRSIDPAQAEQAFVRANPGLMPAAIAVACERTLLREVRICLTKDLSFRACPEVDRRGCRGGALLMPAAGER